MRRLSFLRRRVTRAATQTSSVLGLAMIAMLWTGICLKYMDQSGGDYRDAVQNNYNLTLLFEENVLRSIGEADKALFYMRRQLEEQQGAVDYQRIVSSSDIISETIVQYAIIDAAGMMQASSALPRSAPIDLSDREHYLFHRDRNDDELYVSRPMVGRASGKWSIQLTRRVVSRDGDFGGVVVASLNPEHFMQSYRSIDLGQTGSIALIGFDGSVRAASGPAAFGRYQLGQDLNGSRLVEEARTQQSGTFLDSKAEGGPRIVTFRRVRGLPLAVTVSIAEAQVYSQAYTDAFRHSIIGFLLTLVILGVVAKASRDQLRLRLAKSKLLRSQRRALQKSEQLKLTLDNMSQGIILVTKDYHIPVINQQAIQLLDLPPDFLRRSPKFTDLVAYQDSRGEYASVPIPDGLSAVEYFTRRDPDGALPAFERTRPNGVVLEVRSTTLPDGGFVRTFTDITRRRQAQEAVVRLAAEDALTGLANRRLFRDELEKCAQRLQAAAEEDADEGFALLCLDLDWFKVVNDTLGHWIGDTLLKAVAERLTTTVRAGHLVARLGGDEFAVLLPHARSTEQPEAMAARLVQALSQPYEVYGQQISIGVSIGIALAPHDGSDPELLLKAGDMALYAAKAAGRGTYRFFHKNMAEQLRVKRQLELDLRSAIDNDELALHYQPLIHIAGKSISGFEALMRWDHPIRGPVSPAEFIPIAEETGLIIPLGAWALRKACEQATTWPEEISVAVNVSPMQFRSGNLVSTVCEVLRETGLAPERLELEITETILMQDSDVTIHILHQLRDLGVRISMDDFGTGYSSLSYLRSFPLSKIKIDRAFVKDLGTASASDVIIRSVIDIAKTLKMETTAEGVETRDQFQLLSDLGCTEAQGYHLSKAVPVAQIPELIDRWSKKSIAA